MFDFAWTEVLVIAVVLLVVVGPKDLPPMLRAFGKMTTKLRRTASEFRSQFEEALREAEMDDVRQTLEDARKLNPAQALRDAITPLRTMGEDIKADLQRSTEASHYPQDPGNTILPPGGAQPMSLDNVPPLGLPASDDNALTKGIGPAVAPVTVAGAGAAASTAAPSAAVDAGSKSLPVDVAKPVTATSAAAATSAAGAPTKRASRRKSQDAGAGESAAPQSDAAPSTTPEPVKPAPPATKTPRRVSSRASASAKSKSTVARPAAVEKQAKAIVPAKPAKPAKPASAGAGSGTDRTATPRTRSAKAAPSAAAKRTSSRPATPAPPAAKVAPPAKPAREKGLSGGSSAGRKTKQARRPDDAPKDKA